MEEVENKEVKEEAEEVREEEGRRNKGEAERWVGHGSRTRESS